MKHLKLFETQAAYEAADSSLILPNVSLTVDNNTVHYNPSSPTPPTPSHDYVEIGGVKWATMNVGAESVIDYGLFFQWGGTKGYTADQVGSGYGKKYFNHNNTDCVWSDVDEDDNVTFTKYNSTDHKTVLDLEDDAVNAAWGGNWRMPTKDNFQALLDATTFEWVSNYENSGVAGYVFTSNADSSKKLFLPAGGQAWDGTVPGVNISISYWSSTLNSGGWTAFSLYAKSDSQGERNPHISYGQRGIGCSVRGILDE